ncbi:MAG: polyhydroxyalkanoic acid system family protein [Ferruginibacter sp.]|nr:polyhydroxyalkanoic acid system family protein [Chitinophagaceae bacterium]
MSHIDIKVPHTLPREEAMQRIKTLLTSLQGQYAGMIKNVFQQWDSNEGRFSFSVKGFSVSGKIYIGVDTVRLGSKLPFLLSFYKEKITEQIMKQGTELLKNNVTV